MNLHVHRVTRWRIRRLFTKGLASREHRAVFRALADCPSCANDYERYALAEAGLCGDPNSPSVFALERGASAVLDRVAEGEAPAGGLERWRHWAVASVAATVAAASIALVLLPTRPMVRRVALPGDAQLVEAGLFHKGAEAARSSAIGVRLFRVVLPARVDEGRGLTLADTVTLTYTNTDAEIRYLAVLGIQEDGEIRWYYPGPAEDRSIEAMGEVVDEPLGHGFPLSSGHRSGWLRVTALFSSRPLLKSEVEEAVRALLANSPESAQLAPLSFDHAGVLEHSLRVEISSRE